MISLTHARHNVTIIVRISLALDFLICSIVHSLCGVVITGIAIDWNKGKADKFNCNLGQQPYIL